MSFFKRKRKPSFGELIADIVAEDFKKKPPRIDVVDFGGQPWPSPRAPLGDPIPRLREYWGVAAPAAERFTVGQIVKPKPRGYSHAMGVPHMVIEILAEPLLYAPQAACATDETPTFSKCWGARLDMRVIHEGAGGEIHAHWVESWTFEGWPVDGE